MNKNLLKHILIPGVGFGIGGVYWGYELFKEILEDSASAPFCYPIEFIIFGIIGGISLVLIFNYFKKKSWRIILLGIVGFFIASLIGCTLSYPLGLYGRMIGMPFLFFSTSPGIIWESLTGLVLPNSSNRFLIGDFFFIFALIGFIIGAFYALALKIKVLSLAKYGAIGFALGSLIGPIIGNGILNLFGSLLLTYLITFFIICAFLGAFLGLGIYKSSVSKTLDKNFDAENSNSKNF
jgi:hypothetical protein